MKIKVMTNYEWVQKHEPSAINELSLGGAFGCPQSRGLENFKCDGYLDVHGGAVKCYLCWQMPAKRNGKYIAKREVNNG